MAEMQYQVTVEQKDKISPHLPSGTKLFFLQNGNDYMAMSDVAHLRNKDSLFDLIIKTEFATTDVDAWLAALPQFGFEDVENAAEDGFKTYREMIARINNGGGLSGNPANLDTEIMIYIGFSGDPNTMVVPMTGIRDMMKDGFFEFALRSISHYADARAVGITPTVLAGNVASIRTVAKAHGRADAVLDYAQLSPKGSLV